MHESRERSRLFYAHNWTKNGVLIFPRRMAQKENIIPLFWASIADNDEGMFRVSLVDEPAVERTFMAFNASKSVPVYAVSNEEKRLVRGVLMRANFPIYRKDAQIGEYYIAFSPATIRRMVERFLVEGHQGDVNVMHIPGSSVEGVDPVQMFIKDSAAGINPTGFEDVEDGSLFGEYHVTNDGVWEDIKRGRFRGFSIEGVFGLSESFHKTNKEQMSKFEKIKARLAKILAEFGAVSTDKGVLFWDGDEDLKAGDTVQIEDENGERKSPADGDYTTEDGKTIRVVDGKVAEIADPKAEVAGAGDQPGDDAPNPSPENDPKPEDGSAELREIKDRLDKIESIIDRILKALESANVEIKALKQAPAASSAHEEFTTGAKPGLTGNPKLDRLAAVISSK